MLPSQEFLNIKVLKFLCVGEQRKLGRPTAEIFKRPCSLTSALGVACSLLTMWTFSACQTWKLHCSVFWHRGIVCSLLFSLLLTNCCTLPRKHTETPLQQKKKNNNNNFFFYLKEFYSLIWPFCLWKVLHSIKQKHPGSALRQNLKVWSFY